MRELPHPIRRFRRGLQAATLVAAALLAACGGGSETAATPADSLRQANSATPRKTACPPEGCGPLRLSIHGSDLHGPDGQPIRLRGANLEGLTAADADALAGKFGMNLARLRISYIPDNRADNDTGFDPNYLAQIDEWVRLLQARKIWILLEMRANDKVANDPAFYDITKTTLDCTEPTRCADFAYYQRAWRTLVARYHADDYIAGYGLLAEPSVNKTGDPDRVMTLLRFQKALMDNLSGLDSVTPFFVGPDYNYDTMEYARSEYATELLPFYRNRLVYEVNFLMPKEWVQDGSWTVDDTKPAYPMANPPDGYQSLLDGGKPGQDMEQVFNDRRRETDNYPKTLSPGFIAWYLQWPLKFRGDYQVPLYVDQFGASSQAIGQLRYEGDLLRYFETQKLHWSRWSYNAGGNNDRMLVREDPNQPSPNDPVIRLYATLGGHW